MGRPAQASWRNKQVRAGHSLLMVDQETEAADSRFEAVFVAHYPDVLAFALRRVDGRASADDVVADTFAVAWRRRDKLPEPALPWLYGVARRVIANQRRSSRRQARLGARLKSEVDTGSDGRDAADIINGRESVLTAFGRLPESSREVLRLVAWEELDAKSAAAALGCSAAAFRVRLHRARRHLARELDRDRVEAGTHPGLSANKAKPEEAR